MKERLQRRKTFNAVAELYDRVRPGYPEALFDDLTELANLSDRGTILEIGCGTGQATRSLARRGFEIICAEMGESLAKVAQRNFATYDNVTIKVGDFETMVFGATFDLIFSATAFHWLDPVLRYQKAARLLTEGGFFAPCWNVHFWTEESQGFFEEVQSVYLNVVPDMAANYPGLPRTPEDIDHLELETMPATGLFTKPELLTYRWSETYSTARYLELLSTYSDHRRLTSSVRARLFEGIANLIDSQYGGQVTKGYLSVLYVAQKL